MSSRKRLQTAAAITALTVGAAGFILAGNKSKCVRPDCDATEKEVDCYRVSPGPFLQPEVKARWFGCNVFLRSESKGSKCVPAECVEAAIKKPRILE